MTMGERIIIFVFCFALISVAFNSSGIWSDSVPTPAGTNITNARIEEITEAPKASSGIDFVDSITGGIKFVMQSLGLLKELAMSTLDIGGTLSAYGIPSYIVVPVTSLILLSIVFMLLKWKANRP